MERPFQLRDSKVVDFLIRESDLRAIFFVGNPPLFVSFVEIGDFASSERCGWRHENS